ncbi:hypothetical protein CPB86DRAFT_875933 [Serendipita vermifera]|nr:hypothetical protein CPB86DRAFT_875933 [Serendipita vermifera]
MPFGFDYDFLVLEKDPELIRETARFLFDDIFGRQPQGIHGEKAEKLVSSGIGTYMGGDQALIHNETLTHVACMKYLTTYRLWTWEYFLKDGISVSNDVRQGIAFEHFGAFVLSRAFQSARPLSQVFEFIGNDSLKDEVAELVAVYKEGDTFHSTPIDTSANPARDTYRLGRTTSTTNETLDWLKNPNKAIFCLPPKGFGPNSVFVLRLSDEKLVRVLVYFEHLKEGDPGPQKTKGMLEMTNPRSFCVTDWNASPTLKEELVGALGSLGSGTTKAGALSVLRVIVTYPGKVDRETIASTIKDDADYHPTATVDMAALVQEMSGFDMTTTLVRELLASMSR